MHNRAFILILVVTVAAASSAMGQFTHRASVNSSGGQGDHFSTRPALSASGTLVAFTGPASNLIAGDGNGDQDIFVHDRVSGFTTRVSVSSAGLEADAQCTNPSISADGRFVAFDSLATNLVAGDTNGLEDVFVHDRRTGETRRVSMATSGAQANGKSHNANISADGRWVAFQSQASNLVPIDLNGTWDVFVHDTWTNTTACASVGLDGLPAAAYSWEPAISSDGRFVSFESRARNIVLGKTYGHMNVFVRDMLLGTSAKVSLAVNGGASDASSYSPSISADGQRVSFWSEALNLVEGDTNGVADVFVHDRASGHTTRVSVHSSGIQGNMKSAYPVISGDGHVVAFGSQADNLVDDDTNDHWDSFAHDCLSGETTRLSLDSAGVQANDESEPTAISSDGGLVAVESRATNLVPDDTNGFEDVFVRDRLGCSPTIATYCASSATSIPGCRAAIGASGTPSLGKPAQFAISSGEIPGGDNLGIAYFSTNGPDLVPFGTQGGFLCVSSPVHRSEPSSAGGTHGSCDGELVFSLADLLAPNPNAVEPGSTIHVAIWFRDPPNPDAFALSDGLWFHVCP